PVVDHKVPALHPAELAEGSSKDLNPECLWRVRTQIDPPVYLPALLRLDAGRRDEQPEDAEEGAAVHHGLNPYRWKRPASTVDADATWRLGCRSGVRADCGRPAAGGSARRPQLPAALPASGWSLCSGACRRRVYPRGCARRTCGVGVPGLVPEGPCRCLAYAHAAEGVAPGRVASGQWLRRRGGGWCPAPG